MKNNNLQQTETTHQFDDFFVICAPYNASHFLHLIENIFMYYV